MTDRSELQIVEEWRGPLARAGLDRLDALLGSGDWECVSYHTRGQTYRLVLPAGDVVFLKRDALTMAKHIIGDLLRLRRPQPQTFKERLAIQRVAALGIATPQVIAWGQRRRRGLPWRAAMLTTCLPGVPLNEYLAARAPGRNRRTVLEAVGCALAKLYRAGLSWPDLVPRHIHVGRDARVGMLDLERLRPRRNAMRRCMPRQVGRFCRMLRDDGVAEEDLAALFDGFELDEVADRIRLLRA